MCGKRPAYCPIREHTQCIDTANFGSQFSMFIDHTCCAMLLAMRGLSFGSSGKEQRPHKERDFIIERSIKKATTTFNNMAFYCHWEFVFFSIISS